MVTWAKSRPMLRGKELILKALVTSRVWFLATVNGMPDIIEKEMTRNMKNFLWNNQRGLIEMSAATAPRGEGGLGIPDIKARLKAIQIMWLQRYLAPRHKRPTWAQVADELIKKDISTNTTPKLDDQTKISWIKQSWRKKQGKHSKLPEQIKTMLKIAEEYNTKIQARKTDKNFKEEMVTWLNVMDPKIRYKQNKKAAICLRKNHKIIIIGQLR